ncbi:hypothetical protein HX91_0931 [Mycobacterium tuberculosis]|nr:hypothetical protein HX91_0931 [Mycobacterium tuberculosis]
MTRIADWSCARVLVVAAVSRGHEDAAFDLGFARLPMPPQLDRSWVCPTAGVAFASRCSRWQAIEALTPVRRM